MVWGGISHVGKTNLKIVVGNLNGIRYRDEILAPIVLPFIRTHHFNHVFQQDNARCHISCATMSFRNDNHIRTLPWPELSPDLNPIEHLWDKLGRRVRMRVNPPESIDQLQRALTDEWNNIPQAFVMRLIGSMRRRCLTVRECNKTEHPKNVNNSLIACVFSSCINDTRHLRRIDPIRRMTNVCGMLIHSSVSAL